MTPQERDAQIAKIILGDTLKSGGDQALATALEELNTDGVNVLVKMLSIYMPWGIMDPRFVQIEVTHINDIVEPQNLESISQHLKEQIGEYLQLDAEARTEIHRVRNIQ